MGARGILVLLLLVAGLGAALWLTDEKAPVDKVATILVLQGRSLNDCTSMRWQFHDRQPIEIGRAPDGRFQLREPIVDIASLGYLRPIIVAWDSADMRATPLADDDKGREQAGLSPPELVMTVVWPDVPPLTVEVGAPGPLGDSRFLRVHGRIWEGGGALLETMRVGLDDLRERSVFRNAFAHATELRVKQRTPSGKVETIHLQAGKDGWRLLEPIQARADGPAAQDFVTAVLALRADDFQVGPMKPPKGDPAIEVVVHGAYGQESVELWQHEGQLYGLLPGRGMVFLAEERQYAHVFQYTAERLRSRILLPMGESTFAEVVEIVVDPGQGRGDRLRLLRDTPAADWRLVEPTAHPAGPTPCAEALQALQLLSAREFVEDAAAVTPRANDPRYGLQPASRVAVSVRTARSATPTTLWLGADAAARGAEPLVFACRADEPDTVVLVQQANAAALRRPWLDYCSLAVVRQPPGVDRLDLTRGSEKRTFQLDDGKWHLVGSTAERAEVGGLVNDLLIDLTGTKAVDARGAAFDAPDWTLVLARRNGDELDRLGVWDRGPAQLLLVQRRPKDERPKVAFEINKLISDQLRALWQ